MKRGGIRTHRKYVTEEDGSKKIKYEIQGRRKGTWISVVEKNSEGIQIPMIYDTLKEAEIKLKEIAKQVRVKKKL
jgi:hypothetical protein